jgi:hypothetical protein
MVVWIHGSHIAHRTWYIGLGELETSHTVILAGKGMLMDTTNTHFLRQKFFIIFPPPQPNPPHTYNGGMANDYDNPAAELINTGNVALRAGTDLLNSGFIVVSALMFIIGLLVIGIWIIYKDKRQTEEFLRDIQVKTLQTLSEMKAAVTALAQSGGNGNGGS